MIERYKITFKYKHSGDIINILVWYFKRLYVKEKHPKLHMVLANPFLIESGHVSDGLNRLKKNMNEFQNLTERPNVNLVKYTYR